jgi:hypothetical protein
MRKGVLVVHIVSAGAWIGIDVVMGVLIFTALLSADDTSALLQGAGVVRGLAAFRGRIVLSRQRLRLGHRY